MADRDLPSAEQLRQLISYNPDTGTLVWLPRPVSMFYGKKHSADQLCNSWNAKHAGKECFVTDTKGGYLGGILFRRKIAAHRVAWAVHYGEWPRHQIDHINGIVTDNRIVNLRDVTASMNRRNQRIRSDNKSGVAGVRWDKRSNRWAVSIGINGRIRHLGQFTSKEEAVNVRLAAASMNGFTPRHGNKEALG